MSDANKAIRLTDEEKRELIKTRRDLHRHPEIAFEEKRTAALVADRLRALGLEPRTGIAGTGVTATLGLGGLGGSGAQAGPDAGPGATPASHRPKRVLLRADMDALPVREENDVDYRSTVEGKMHGCGHDGHTSILLAVAKMLGRLSPPPAGSVELLFQPAEEIANGARAMIDAGVLDAEPVDAAFGLHLWNYLPLGKVGVSDGPVMAAADEFNVTIVGEGCHAALPHIGRDAVLAAAHVVTALQQIVSRRVDPLDSAVVSVGSIHGGDTFNVIPAEVKLSGTVRSFSNEVYDAVPKLFEETVRLAAKSMGCEAKIEYIRSARPVINDAAMAELVRDVAREIVGPENVVEERTMGAEDFGEFLHRVPGCFFFVGSKNDRLGKVHPHHSPRFDFDEAALALSAELLAAVACRYLQTA